MIGGRIPQRGQGPVAKGDDATSPTPAKHQRGNGMRCPNCGNEQPNQIECDRCGIIFARYHKRQEERAAAQAGGTPPQSGSGGSRFGLFAVGILLLAVTVATGYRYFVSGPTRPAQPLPSERQGIAAQPSVPTERPHAQSFGRAAGGNSTAADTDSQFGLIGQFAARYAPRNPIEWARNATVFIRTPWGSGSGFFVTKNGYIVTNRHVVEFDHATLTKLKNQMAQLAEWLGDEQQNIAYYKQQVQGIKQPDLRSRAEKEIARHQASYDKNAQIYRDVEKKLQEIQQATWVSDIKVVLIDGSEFAVQSLKLSDKSDLALLAIDCVNAPAIPPAANSLAVPQGEKVYTIGNPAGLRHTVTAGIVSGYRTHSGAPYIQTDAPINPGNSGGPLIDATGNLLGVNTMILRGTEGIGFAIPFQTVREEFGDYLPSR